MPDPDPASPVYNKDGRSRIECGMTPFDSLKQGRLKMDLLLFERQSKINFDNHTFE